MFGSCLRFSFPQDNNAEYSPSRAIFRGGRVVDGSISSNGKFIISAAKMNIGPHSDGVMNRGGVCIHNADTGSVSFEPNNKGDHVVSCRMDQTCSRFVTGLKDGQVLQWAVASGRELSSFLGHTKPVTGTAFPLTGNKLASSSFDGTARVWDAVSGSGSLCNIFRHLRHVTSVDISSDARTVYTSCGDNRIHAWDVLSGREAFSLQGHTQATRGCKASRDGVRIASCSQDGTVRLWDVRRPSELFVVDFGESVYACDMTANSRYVVACGDHGKAAFVDTSRPDQPVRLLSNEKKLFSCSISSAGARVITCGEDGRVWIYMASPNGFLDPSGTNFNLFGRTTKEHLVEPTLSFVDPNETSLNGYNRGVTTEYISHFDNRWSKSTGLSANATPFISEKGDNGGFGQKGRADIEDFEESCKSSSTADEAEDLIVANDPPGASNTEREEPGEEDESSTEEKQISEDGNLNTEKEEHNSKEKKSNSAGEDQRIEEEEQIVIAPLENNFQHLISDMDEGSEHRGAENRADKIGALTVAEVSDLMCLFVCKPLNTERASKMRRSIQYNVDRRSISGRGLMMHSVSEQFVAQSILFTDSSNLNNLQQDFMYLELVEFIRQLRRGTNRMN